MNLTSYLSITELIFPKACILCHNRSELVNNFLCSSCYKKLEFLEEPVYDSFSQKSESENGQFSFDYARSVFPLSGILRTLIHYFKYEEMTKIGAFLAQYSSKYIRTYPFPEKIDYILPIPLHPVKKRMRGFNQAEILSKEIANSLGVKHTPDLIVRKKFTQTQTKLKREERQKNVSEAFQVNRRFSLQNKVILIVDDVFTTGSTTNSISAILKKNEAKYVFVLTIARA